MGETDADWQLLADERQDIHARLEVAARILRTDDPRIDVLCTIFVDVSVATGNIRRAFDQAIAAAVANLRVPEVPNTGGPNARGVSGQDWEPYELRNLNAPVFAALARRSFERPLLAHWLFEATKLYAAERIEAIDALEQANTEPSLAAGIASVVALADAQPDPGGDVLRDLASAWVKRPTWLVSLLEAVEASPPAADHLADALYSAELDGPPLDDDALRPRIVALAQSAPSGARALAIAALRLCEPFDELDSILVMALSDAEAHERVVEAAARLAAARQLLGPAVIDAATLAAERIFDDSLDALLAMGRAALGGGPTLSPGPTCAVVEGPCHLGMPFVLGELAAASAHRVRAAVPIGDWATDDDEVAVAVVGKDFAAYHVAPVRFLSRKTGASGARRSIEVAGVHQGRLVIAITSPFSDRRGWGNDNYVIGCDPRDGSWVAYRIEGETLALDRVLDSGLPLDEADLPHASFGQAITWTDEDGLHLVPDGTPYHLDDFETNPIVREAMAAREVAATARAAELISVITPSLHAELARAWPAYDPGDHLGVHVLQRDGHRIARLQMSERQALVWLGT